MRNLSTKKPISEEVYDKIKMKILKNILEPGERLVEMELAKELSVSRTPVREALKQLEQDGLVIYYPRKGSIVSEVSVEDALELYQVRESLEGLAVKIVCLNISRKEIRDLEEIVKEMKDSIILKDHIKLKGLHGKWSEAIISMANNKYLKSTMISLYENLGRTSRVSLYYWEQSVLAYEETKHILDSIIKGDEEESERLAKLHVRNAKERYLSTIKKN